MSCLQTKLTEDVSENLFKVDEVEITFDLTGEAITNRRIQVNNNGYANIPMRIVGGNDAYFTDSSGAENYGKTLSATPNQQVYLSAAKFKLFIGDKYRWSEFVATNINYGKGYINEETLKSLPALFQFWPAHLGGYGFDGKLDIDEIDMSFVKNFNTLATNTTPNVKGHLTSLTCDTMTRVSLGWQNVIGELKDLQHMASTLATVDLTRCDITGAVTDIGSCVAITSLNLSNLPNITGDVKDMLDAMYSAGRTSGTISVNGTTSGIKYNGSAFTSKSFTFSAGGWSENA